MTDEHQETERPRRKRAGSRTNRSVSSLSPKERREIADVCQRVLAESDLRGGGTKQALVETLEGLLSRQRVLLKKERAGVLPAEEARTVPSVASNIKRICDALGVTQQRSDDGDTDEL